MRCLTSTLLVVILAAVLAPAQTGSAAAFDKLKSLVGQWEGKSAEGVVNVYYRLTAGGTALVETTQMPGEGEMVTVYHRDGDSLVMTHYCMANNQPRMRATPQAGTNELNFELIDVSNLPDPTQGHMHHLTLTLEDANHITQRWTWKKAGQQQVFTFRLSRKT